MTAPAKRSPLPSTSDASGRSVEGFAWISVVGEPNYQEHERHARRPRGQEVHPEHVEAGEEVALRYAIETLVEDAGKTRERLQRGMRRAALARRPFRRIAGKIPYEPGERRALVARIDEGRAHAPPS